MAVSEGVLVGRVGRGKGEGNGGVSCKTERLEKESWEKTEERRKVDEGNVRERVEETMCVEESTVDGRKGRCVREKKGKNEEGGYEI